MQQGNPEVLVLPKGTNSIHEQSEYDFMFDPAPIVSAKRLLFFLQTSDVSAVKVTYTGGVNSRGNVFATVTDWLGQEYTLEYSNLGLESFGGRPDLYLTVGALNAPEYRTIIHSAWGNPEAHAHAAIKVWQLVIESNGNHDLWRGFGNGDWSEPLQNTTLVNL